mmetsp:Transcript_8648/g.15551  ORF Transcript_8648/g.15551 Transcript_8648/m.15551 type:complete len:210 (+) Transcript_8648:298-927(+)
MPVNSLTAHSDIVSGKSCSSLREAGSRAVGGAASLYACFVKAGPGPNTGAVWWKALKAAHFSVCICCPHVHFLGFSFVVAMLPLGFFLNGFGSSARLSRPGELGAVVLAVLPPEVNPCSGISSSSNGACFLLVAGGLFSVGSRFGGLACGLAQRSNSLSFLSGMGPSSRPCTCHLSLAPCMAQNSEPLNGALVHCPPAPPFHVRAMHKE